MANTTKGKGNGAKKKTAPKTKAGASAKKAPAANDNAARGQLSAIILFAVSLLLICLAFIPGEAVWGALRSLLFGLFGFTSYIWPVILIYIAIMTTLGKFTSKIGYKVAEAALLTVMISTAIHIFTFFSKLTSSIQTKKE